MRATVEDLVVWLRAQLDEDERLARAVEHPRWRLNGGEVHVVDDYHPIADGVMYGDMHDPLEEGVAEHIAEHNPARVLGEVDAKRLIVELHSDQHECTDSTGAAFPYVGCTTLRLLALPYSDRPGYREEWRP